MAEYTVENNTLIFQEGVTTIKKGKYPKDIESIQFPSSLKRIGWEAFYKFPRLKRVVFPKGLESIGKEAFKKCDSLTELVFPEGSESLFIGDEAFCACPSLSKVYLPKSIKDVGNSAFSDCLQLKKVEMEKSVYENLHNNVFENTPFLDNLRRNNSLVILDGILFDGATYKGNLVIPEGVEYVVSGAFRFNKRLTSVVMPASVKTVGHSAFEGCTALEKVTLPTSMESLAENLFLGCSSLK